VYGETSIDSLWNKLGKINLGDAKARAEITAFMVAERNRKGGNAGAEFEQRYAIIMRNIGIADSLSASATARRTAIVSSASAQAGAVRSEVRASPSAVPVTQAAVPSTQAPRAAGESGDGPEIQSRYNERMISSYEKPLAEILGLLAKGNAKQKALLVPLRAAMKDKNGITVAALQADMRRIDAQARVSREGDPDGYFGPLTLAALRDIARIKSGARSGARDSAVRKPSAAEKPPADGAPPVAEKPPVADTPPVMPDTELASSSNPNRVFYKE
jgi:hypothetical protein